MLPIEHGDFRFLSPPAGATLVCTDPPYNKGHNYGPVSDQLSPDDYDNLLVNLVEWAHINTGPDAHLFIVHEPQFFFHKGRELFLNQPILKWQYRQLIAWCYPSNIGHSKQKFTSSYRSVLWLTKGSPYVDVKGDPLPYQNPDDARILALMEAGSPGRAPYDWWPLNLQKKCWPLLSRLFQSITDASSPSNHSLRHTPRRISFRPFRRDRHNNPRRARFGPQSLGE